MKAFHKIYYLSTENLNKPIYYLIVRTIKKKKALIPKLIQEKKGFKA
jgi:hypothetical protein